jgi:hypothetical protein
MHGSTPSLCVALGHEVPIHLLSLTPTYRPMEPAKKPEAAPFFLPTVAGLSRTPVFDTAATSVTVAAQSGGAADGGIDGDGTDGDGYNGQGGGAVGSAAASCGSGSSSSRILNVAATGGPNDRGGAAGGAPVSAFVALLRPVALDREVRALVVSAAICRRAVSRPTMRSNSF